MIAAASCERLFALKLQLLVPIKVPGALAENANVIPYPLLIPTARRRTLPQPSGSRILDPCTWPRSLLIGPCSDTEAPGCSTSSRILSLTSTGQSPYDVIE